MRTIGITIIVIAVAVLLLLSIQEYFAIGACLDSGKVYEYGTGECRSDIAQAPYIPYFKRFSWLTTSALLAVLAGVACVFAARRNKR